MSARHLLVKGIIAEAVQGRPAVYRGVQAAVLGTVQDQSCDFDTSRTWSCTIWFDLHRRSENERTMDIFGNSGNHYSHPGYQWVAPGTTSHRRSRTGFPSAHHCCAPVRHPWWRIGESLRLTPSLLNPLRPRPDVCCDCIRQRFVPGGMAMAEITTAARRPSSRPASSARPCATNRLSSWYARHNSLHVAIKICLGEVQCLNGI